MKRAAALALLAAGCWSFDADVNTYCAAHRGFCPIDGGTAGGAGGGTAGGAAGGTAGGSIVPPLLSEPPAISGAVQEGQTLIGDAGMWTGATQLDLAWWRIAADGGAPLRVGNGPTYTIAAGDVRQQLRFDVDAGNSAGNVYAQSPLTRFVRSRPALVFWTGFEHGGPVLPEGAGSTGGTRVSASGASVTRVAPRTGTSVLSISAATGTDPGDFEVIPIGVSSAVVRVAVSFQGPTTSDLISFRIRPQSVIAVRTLNDGKLHLTDDTLEVVSGGVDDGGWHLVDLWVQLDNLMWRVAWQVDGVELPPLEATRPGSVVDAVILGRPLDGGLAGPIAVSYDDFALSSRASDYPIGDGEVLGVQPSGTGMHAQASTFHWFTGGGASTGVIPDAGDISTYLDDFPPRTGGSADWIEQQANSAFGHLEVGWSPPGGKPLPNGVRFLLAALGADGGTESGPDMLSSIGGAALVRSTRFSGCGCMEWFSLWDPAGPNTAQPWTASELFASRLLLGRQMTAAADSGFWPQMHGVLIEVDYPR